jgi:acyl-CoA synthetase (NDP forming)
MTLTAAADSAGIGGGKALAPAIEQIRRQVRLRQPGGMGEATSRGVLKPLGLPFVPSTAVHSAEEAVATAVRLGGPVVLKALSDKVLHKSDAGLVELGLAAPEQVRIAYQRLVGRVAALGVSDAIFAVQPMAPAGTDLFLGWVRDPTFGPIITVGLGGITVELFRDVARAVPPLTANDAGRMLASLACAPLLDGYRGAPPVDTTQFCELAGTISELAIGVPELAELDLNPIRVLADGSCLLLDARAVLEPGRPTAGRAGAAPRDLRPLMRPGSIAVVGASRDASRPGARVLRTLREHGFAGPIYPVNPAGGQVGGLPAVTTLAEAPELPDLVCVALPAAASVETVRECVRLGVPAVIVFASGFSESGSEGKRLDDELRSAVAGSPTMLCGPNTIGVVSAHHQMAATFSRALDGVDLRASGTCLIAQSGAVAGSLVSRELSDGYGIGDWVTVGNQSDLDVADYIAYYARLGTTTSIAVFLEGTPDGARFRDALHAARSAQLPVVVFKTGVTAAGQRAVSSHSAALAGSEAAYRAVFEHEGAVQVTEMTALLEVAWTLGNSPRPAGRRVAVVTTSGGAGSAMADLVSTQELVLASLTDPTKSELSRLLPPFANIDNPLDVTAEGPFTRGTLGRALELVADDPQVDMVCVVLTTITGADAVRIANDIAALAGPGRPPLLVCWLVARSLATEGMALLAQRGIRVFNEPARMAAAAGYLANKFVR